MPPLPFYCRWWFAPILIAGLVILGALSFVALKAVEPIDDLDFWFYFGLWSGIGAATGFGTWYLARLIALRRASLTAILVLLLPAYLFVAFLGLDKNPIIAVVATIAFGFMVLMGAFANHFRQRLPAD